MLILAFVVVGWVFYFFVFFFLSDIKCSRVLVSGEYSGPVFYLGWNCGDFGSLDPAWPLVNPKSSSELVGRNMDPRSY